MGPTWPNRFYLHAGDVGGQAEQHAVHHRRAHDLGIASTDAGVDCEELLPRASSPGARAPSSARSEPQARCKGIDEFFDDARAARCRTFSIIDPGLRAPNDDHPDHDISCGPGARSRASTRRSRQSPQWTSTLLRRHLRRARRLLRSRPAAEDRGRRAASFDQLGFRVPTFVVGGMVKKGHVENTVFDHCSVAATVKTRWNIQSLGPRMDAAASLAACIDPALYKNPAPPPPNMPMPMMSLEQALTYRVGKTSQPELMAMVEDGTIPPQYVDKRPSSERIGEWMFRGEKLGAVKIAR